MDSSRDRFDVYGPTHMMGAGSSAAMIDWGNEEYRRRTTSCLVKATYVLETDRKLKRRAEAPAWYESCGFRLIKPLTEVTYRKKATIFGAIYEYAPAGDDARRHRSAPRHVVAFRGTMLKGTDWEVKMKDLGLDTDILVTNNYLEHTSRSRLARRDVDQLIDGRASTRPQTPGDVWLAGHSLGATLALDVGRYMMDERKLNLPTILFNLPHVSLAPLLKLLRVKDEKVRKDLYYTTYFLKVGAALLLRPLFGSHWRRIRKMYQELSPWVPNLYVNDMDLICQGYVDYFHLRDKFEKRFRDIGSWSSAAKEVSFRNMLFYMLRKLRSKDKERLNILSSVTLWENKQQGWGGAHRLQNWWEEDVELTKSVYTTVYDVRV